MLWSGQIRLHHAHHCDAYLSTRSRPILEHCRSIRVAPTRFDYAGAAAAVEVCWWVMAGPDGVEECEG